ncbi:tudor domain-containing protein 5-like isoform X2 [Melanerpes formicivorus]|uniref:tudor domain-containing protein 5-like isoform X2 n=1 Tax=Melanerpes formicivorus TaxID=211600 RepID=UPI00358E8C2E
MGQSGVDMAKQAQVPAVLKKEIRSLLIAAKGGLTPAELEEVYLTMVGKPLPLRDLGARSTLALVAGMPDVVRICPSEKGTSVLKAVADETTKGIAKLVARQRGGKGWKGAAVKAGAAACPQNPQRDPPRGRAPVLPATVKAELQHLLSSSPVFLSDFDKAFCRHFGQEFQYTQYGFSSLAEVLSSVSDIITVVQTAAGPLLTLKYLLASEIEKEGMLQAPAAEKPPLEPSHETQSCQLPAEEKSEPVESQTGGVGDGLQQPQDLEQPLPDKLLLTPEIPADAVEEGRLCGLPPLERRSAVGVFVAFVVSPSQFYIHVRRREASHELLDLMIAMRHCYSDRRLCDRYVMPERSVRPGQLCCVRVAAWWYRVIVHRVLSHQQVEVFYADYGNLDPVPMSALRFLKRCYLKLPAQAIPCSLARVKPTEDTWSSAATILFEELCGSELLVGFVDEYVHGILHLFLCDTSSREDVYFHRVLSTQGHAAICEENIPSQGFMELNPLALYVEPSGQQENAELEEPDLGLPQESLNADSETANSELDGNEQCEQQCQLSAQEPQDDVWPPLDEGSALRTTEQDPELVQGDTHETPVELMAVVKTSPSLGECTLPAALFKSMEDFDTSFVYLKQAAAVSQHDPDQTEGTSKENQLCEAVQASILLTAMPFMLDKPDAEEQVKNKVLPRSPAAVLCSASGLPGCGLSQKLYVPPAMLSAVLTSARLASSPGSFQWLPCLRKKM